MNTREKGIIGLMVGTVIFGAFHFLAPSPKTGTIPTQEELKGLDQFIITMAGTLNKQNLVEANYILERAASPCNNDPFLAEKSMLEAVEKKEAVPRPDPLFSYSGFVRIGNKMLAIINGLEYERGDVVEPGGYRVSRITAEQVELNGGGKEHEVLQIMNENL